MSSESGVRNLEIRRQDKLLRVLMDLKRHYNRVIYYCVTAAIYRVDYDL
jgi:hypothetical protein